MTEIENTDLGFSGKVKYDEVLTGLRYQNIYNLVNHHFPIAFGNHCSGVH